MNFWKRKSNRKHCITSRCKNQECVFCEQKRIWTLRDAPAGKPVVITGYMDHMPEHRRIQLMAYGLLPGRQVKICQQYPVTIIQIAFTELALEWDLADAVQIDYE